MYLESEPNIEIRKRKRPKQHIADSYYSVPKEHILKSVNELLEPTLLIYYPDSCHADFYPFSLKIIHSFFKQKFSAEHLNFNSFFVQQLFREFFHVLFYNTPENFEKACIFIQRLLTNEFSLQNQCIFILFLFILVFYPIAFNQNNLSQFQFNRSVIGAYDYASQEFKIPINSFHNQHSDNINLGHSSASSNINVNNFRNLF